MIYLIRLNDDYNSLEEQMRYVKEHVEETSNPLECFGMASLFYQLRQVILDGGRKPIFDDDLGTVGEIGAYFNLSLIDDYKLFFVENKEFLSEILTNTYFQNCDSFIEFFKSSYFHELSNRKYPKLDDTSFEAERLVLAFLEDKFSDAIPIYEDLIKRGNLYSFKNNDPTSRTDGFIVLNAIQGINNVFLSKNPETISSLSTFIHEFGHVYDFVDYERRFSVGEQLLSTKRCFLEVVSSYFQQSFLEFLITNNIRKDESQLELTRYFAGAFNNLDTSMLLLLLNDADYRKVINEDFDTNQVISMIKHTEVGRNYLFADNSKGIRVNGISEVNYALGMVLANTMVNGEVDFEDFLNIRGGNFDSNKLTSIGINADTANKCLTKTIDRHFC